MFWEIQQTFVHLYKFISTRFKPIFDKSGVDANRHGKFLFVCDECTIWNEIKTIKQLEITK